MDRNKGHKALIVDDEQSIRDTLSFFLKDEGYISHAVGRPSEALAYQKKNEVDLALIDVNLPEMDGLALAEKMLAHNRELTVIFITGMDSFDYMIRAIRLGAYDYLKKPLLPGELNLALERFEERRALRKKVLQAEKMNTLLVQNIPVMLLKIDSDLNIASANRACTSMLGFSPEECLAQGWLVSRITENDKIKLSNAILDSQKKGSSLSVIIKLRHKNNRFVYALFQSLPKFADDSGQDGFRCAVTDITDRVLLEKKMILDEKLKTMGAITAEVAHEIRNPLMSIGGFARRLQDRFPKLEEADIIVRESYRLEKILNRINNYLSPIKFEIVMCNAVAILDECLALLEPQITDRKISCYPQFSEDLPNVFADPDLLRQIFINMILGSTKNIPEGSRLDIQAEKHGEFLELRFSTPYVDDNCIDPERIFTPFEDGGMSIGIPLTYRLIKKMDGELNFLTEDSNAIFIINIPACSADQNEYSGKTEDDALMPENPSGSLDTLIQREWLRSAREMKPIGVATLEIENSDQLFDDIEEKRCKKIYENIFNELQEILKRAGDFLSTTGIRTFVAVLPGTDKEGAENVAMQMKAKTRETVSSATSTPLTGIEVVTGTASEIPNPEHIPDELVDKAVEEMRKQAEQLQTEKN
jgi:PAS domain S-box-containing protein